MLQWAILFFDRGDGQTFSDLIFFEKKSWYQLENLRKILFFPQKFNFFEFLLENHVNILFFLILDKISTLWKSWKIKN